MLKSFKTLFVLHNLWIVWLITEMGGGGAPYVLGYMYLHCLPRDCQKLRSASKQKNETVPGIIWNFFPSRTSDICTRNIFGYGKSNSWDIEYQDTSVIPSSEALSGQYSMNDYGLASLTADPIPAIYNSCPVSFIWLLGSLVCQFLGLLWF